jgi:DNA-binding GntR family transcriptional regulator
MGRRAKTTTIVDDLIARIQTQEIPSGTRLKEADLALQYGVSRGPIREALKALAARNWVTLDPSRGASVAQSEDPGSIDAVFLSSALFALCARLAAMRASQDQLEKISECIVQLNVSLKENAGTEKITGIAHRCAQLVVAAAASPSIAALWEQSLQGGIQTFVPKKFETTARGKECFREWSNLAVALRMHEPAQAESSAGRIPLLMLEESMAQHLNQ